MADSRFCFTHNPETQEEKRQAVLKGGQAPKKNVSALPPVELGDHQSVVRLLCQTINEVREGKVELRTANCIGYLSGHLIKALEVAELEGRVREVEKKLGLREDG